MFAVWAVLRGYPMDWRQLEGTPERKKKGRFDELKVRALKNLFRLDGRIGS
jgi:16S rRNA (cytosine967-C5)-methyltransferase